MARELVDRLNSFSLSSEEKNEIFLENIDIFKRKEESERSLIGRLFGDKKVNFAGFRSTVTAIWQTKESFTVREIGVNLFQFIFSSQEDKIRVLNGKTWSFENMYLVLREWSENILDKIDQLNSVELWVQVWNLPYFWIGVETGRKIGKKFDKILDVVVPETGSSKGLFIRILAVVNLDKPLLRGTYITLHSEKVWVDFRYEKLQNFCFYCGLVGHLERGCLARRDDMQRDKLEEDQFGEWLRVSEVRNNKSLNNFPKATQPPVEQSSAPDKNRGILKSGGKSAKPLSEIGPIAKRAEELHCLEASKNVETKDLHLEALKEDGNKENGMMIDKMEMVEAVVQMEGNRTSYKEIQNNALVRVGRTVKKGIPSRRGGRTKGDGQSNLTPMDCTLEQAEITCGHKRQHDLIEIESDQKYIASNAVVNSRKFNSRE
ncbi:hypothetical protein DH2020_025293 [Rehmannia glutinosa]|uniref:CCHC-type domain-containing protein n=1 Tax=Rehmannia glutinosa TaxID=99300 RepID=A0ABR0W470_REHGL